MLASRIDGLRSIAERVNGRARLTLDPSERHGFEYQSWFGFTIYAEGVRGELGRGGTYCIGGSDEPATGFSLYPEELVEAVKADETLGAKLFLPLGHDRAAADALRAEGWRTVAALDESDDASTLGCTHVLDGERRELSTERARNRLDPKRARLSFTGICSAKFRWMRPHAAVVAVQRIDRGHLVVAQR